MAINFVLTEKTPGHRLRLPSFHAIRLTGRREPPNQPKIPPDVVSGIRTLLPSSRRRLPHRLNARRQMVRHNNVETNEETRRATPSGSTTQRDGSFLPDHAGGKSHLRLVSGIRRRWNRTGCRRGLLHRFRTHGRFQQLEYLLWWWVIHILTDLRTVLTSSRSYTSTANGSDSVKVLCAVPVRRGE